jgi:uncharacterized protein
MTDTNNQYDATTGYQTDGEPAQFPSGSTQALQSFFTTNSKVALAFSGGTDSSLLLAFARNNGCDIKPYMIKSQFQPQFELIDAHRLCRQLGVELTVISVDILAVPELKANPANRCYLCKKRLFTQLIGQARQDGYTVVIDGTNASDDPNDRPGMIAIRELGVLSPLAECGISKEQVRQLSRQLDLFTADKPAYACLATRIPTGQAYTDDLLERVEQAEGKLAELGFADLRVRVMGDDTARLQLPTPQLYLAIEKRTTILEELGRLFSHVLLDLKSRGD